MELKQLFYFIKVAEFGSYTKAANELDIAQPLLSRHIRQLEVELKQHLLIRNGRGVSTTEAGNILLKHSHQIIAQLENLKEDLSLSTGEITGSVTLGIPPTLSKLFARDIIKLFYKRLSHANLIVTEGLTRDLQERLELGRLGIALLHNPNFLPNIEYELLIEVFLTCITRKDNPISLKKEVNADELSTLPLILPSRNNTFRQLFDNEMIKSHQKTNIVLEVDSKELILDLVEDGLGSSILLPMVLDLGQKHPILTTIPITTPELPCHLYMALLNKTVKNRLQKALIEIIKEVCQKYFPKNKAQ
ncbi:MAG: LysR family transcriptional regulator [[Actinobacillus] rossii]|nr:LysR family transcriptional regulator [[Actinobacillus] rossii]